MEKVYNIKDYGALGDGVTLDTVAIQTTIDIAAEEASKDQMVKVVVPSGCYLTSSLFLKSHLEFHLEKGAVLLGTTDESCYPLFLTRVAGIEMEWPVGILNINDQQDVKVTGHGKIDGQGPYWWEKYWGNDKMGGMRKIYEEKGLRWCVDYDCKRVRNLVVMNSKNIELIGFESVRSGFWNIHLCYSKQIHVDGLFIHENEGPSTDGIDVDSCDGVRIEHCKISCNDDNICIKSGRDADGLRVNRICQNIEIKECEIAEGSGVTIGSETSGGARNIRIRDLNFHDTGCGFRVKSAKNRGGTIENVLVENLTMKNVRHPFSMCLNWFPAYSYCELPKDYVGEIPKHWDVLIEKVPEEQGIPQVKNITIRNVISTNDPDYQGISKAIEIEAFDEKPMTNVSFENVKIEAREFGNLSGVKNLKWENVEISLSGE